MKSVGMLLLIVGGLTAFIGLVLLLAPRLPWLGDLPGDIHYRGKTGEFHFPVTTCILISACKGSGLF